MPIAALAQQSDLIVEATVTDVSLQVGGRLIATCDVTDEWKGHAEGVTEVRASTSPAPDWFSPVAGERVVLFLKVSQAGELEIHDWGFGCLPIREVAGEQLATFRHGIVAFPEQVV